MLSNPVQGYSGQVPVLTLDNVCMYVSLQSLMELGDYACIIQGNQALNAQVMSHDVT